MPDEHDLSDVPIWMLPSLWLLSDNTTLSEWFRKWEAARATDD
jgi:hypothetical protein